MGTLVFCLIAVYAFYKYARYAQRRREEATQAVLNRIASGEQRAVWVYLDRTMIVPITYMPFKRQWDFVRTLREQGLISLEHVLPHERSYMSDRYKVILRLTDKGLAELKELRAKTAPPFARTARS